MEAVRSVAVGAPTDRLVVYPDQDEALNALMANGDIAEKAVLPYPGPG